MTPYRERREKGHYNPDGEPPDPTHSHHLTGLMTAPPQETAANSSSTVTVTSSTFTPDATALEAVQQAAAAEEPTEDFSSFSKTELLTLAKERGLSPANAAMSKAELRSALEANE